jgi:hypothetical protein
MPPHANVRLWYGDKYICMSCVDKAYDDFNKEPKMSNRVDTKKLRDGIAWKRSYHATSYGERTEAAETFTLSTNDLEQLLSVYEVAQRWCRRPASVLTSGAANVLANDVEMWRKLRAAVNGDGT